MHGSGVKTGHNWTQIRKCFFLRSACSQEGPLQAQAVGGPKFRHLGAREKLNQSLTNKHFVLIDQGISSSANHL